MAATYDWIVEWMKNYPVHEGQENVVFQVGWRCVATQIENDTEYSATNYGSVGVKYEPSETFTPYADLTKEKVLNWVFENGVNKTELETSLQNQINNKINPTEVQSPLPWVA